jgi:serine/threonine protein phosphatase 1
MPRTIAIGDIHGCDTALETLLGTIQPQPDDLVITLGDVVDRGPNTRRVIEMLLDLRRRCRFVGIQGNHEEMMLRVVAEGHSPYNWLQYGGVATLDSYGFGGDLKVIPEEHLALLKSFVPYFETPTHFFVHANYDPKLPLDRQTNSMLRWKRLDEHLPGPHRSGKVAILGHTADHTGEVLSLKHMACIDTYCHGGQWLTAIEAESGKIWQANEEGQVRS